MEPVVKKHLIEYVYPGEDTKGKRIDPEKHFGLIIDHIRQEAIAMYGPDCDVYRSPGSVVGSRESVVGN